MRSASFTRHFTTTREARRSRQRGQGTVEFALIGPLFLLFMLTIVQGALFMNAQATIDNVTREVARVVAVCGTTSGGWSYQGVQQVDCRSAAINQIDSNSGFVPLPKPSAKQIAVCGGSSVPANGHCAAGSWQDPTAVGQTMEVDVYYTYSFWLDPLLGRTAPTAPINSSARVVVQQ